MASKGTPKKFYKKLPGSTVISRCRLCNSVADPNYSRNLFRDANILHNAEAVYGGKLVEDVNLPHLACRACVRRLNNFSQYRNIVTETQRKLVTENVRTNYVVWNYRRLLSNRQQRFKQLGDLVDEVLILLARQDNLVRALCM